MVTINIYDNAGKQAENAAQETEAPMPQATSLIQESQASSAPQPENTQLNAETAFADKVPAPDLFNGMPLTESDSFISEQTYMQNFANSSVPSPAMQVDVSATAVTSGPAPSMQVDKMNNDQADAPAPSLDPGEVNGEKGSKEEQSKKK